MDRALSVFLKLMDNDRFKVIVRDNETSMTQTFNQDTPDICEKIGVEVMSWLDIMTHEEE